MQCRFCGQNLPDDANWCTRCGGAVAVKKTAEQKNTEAAKTGETHQNRAQTNVQQNEAQPNVIRQKKPAPNVQNVPENAAQKPQGQPNKQPQEKQSIKDKYADVLPKEPERKKIARPKAREEEFIFNIKPAFDPGLVFIRAFSMALLLGGVATTTIGSSLVVILSLLGFMNCIYAFYVTGGTVFLISFLTFLYIAKKNTTARKFTFYQSKMEYTYNAFDGKFRTLDYANIIDSSVTKGPLQRLSNLGNISFICVGSFHDYVVAIGDVRDPDYAYKKIMDLVEIHKHLI